MSDFYYRPWQQQDAPSLALHANDKSVWDNVRDYFPYPYTLKDAQTFIDMARSKMIPEDFAVIVDGAAVGGIGYVPGRNEERVSAEIGYWLGAAYRGRGIMSTLVRQLSDELLESGQLECLYAPVFGFNTSSQRVLEKAGFTRSGTLHRAAVKNGVVTDLCFYEKLRP